MDFAITMGKILLAMTASIKETLIYAPNSFGNILLFQELHNLVLLYELIFMVHPPSIDQCGQIFQKVFLK